MRALAVCGLVAALVGAALFACNPPPPRPCVNPGGQPVLATQVSSPALECPSHICLLQPPNGSSTDITQGQDGGGFRATCTHLCQHDSDCSDQTHDYCNVGSVCAVATDTGSFCCKELCICKSDLVQGVNSDADGGTMIPFACSTANPQPSCPNAPVTN